jgi:hypothetical protein
MAREKMLLDAILKVYAAEPSFAFDTNGHSTSTLGVSTLLSSLSKAAFHLRSPETARDCERCLLALQNWTFASSTSGSESEEHQLAVSLVRSVPTRRRFQVGGVNSRPLLRRDSGRLLHEACRFVGQSLFTSSEDRDHARMIYRLSEQAILSAKAGRLLASVGKAIGQSSRTRNSDLWLS